MLLRLKCYWKCTDAAVGIDPLYFLLSLFKGADNSGRWISDATQIQDSLHQYFISQFDTIRRLHQSGRIYIYINIYIEREREKERERERDGSYKTFICGNDKLSNSAGKNSNSAPCARNYTTQHEDQNSSLLAATVSILLFERSPFFYRSIGW